MRKYCTDFARASWVALGWCIAGTMLALALTTIAQIITFIVETLGTD